MIEHDKGPWKCSEFGSTIESADFEHDVIIYIAGDFANDKQRLAYAENLINLLNKGF